MDRPANHLIIPYMNFEIDARVDDATSNILFICSLATTCMSSEIAVKYYFLI